MSRARAERWLAKIWRGSDLRLVPYEVVKPEPPPKAPSPPPKATAPSLPEAPFEAKMKARLEALLSIPPTSATPSGSSASSSSSSSSSSSASSSGSVGKKRPLKIDVQGARNTQGVAVVDHLYKLGRGPNTKQNNKPTNVRTAALALSVRRDGLERSELAKIQRSQALSVERDRPMLIAESVTQWRKAR